MKKRNGLALVTGGGSGIGLAIARALLDRGWTVAICGRDEAKLSNAALEISGDDPDRRARLLATAADVSKTGDVERWIDTACDRFGDPSLLVNNAGIMASGKVADLSERRWDQAMEINLKGAFLCARRVLPRMRTDGGWIVNIASVAGKMGIPGSSAYSASKFGLIGLTESLAREEAKNGIRATAICPGFVETPMVARAAVPGSEMIRPEDVAATVLYLLDLGPTAIVREIVIERIGSS